MKNNYIILILCLLGMFGYSQQYEFGIVHISNYDFKVVAIPDFDSSGNTDISDVGFTLMLPTGSADVSSQTGLLGGRTWDVAQYDAATLSGLGGDGTEDAFLFNLPPGQTLLSHTNGQQIDLVSFTVTNMPTNGTIRILSNSETVAINASGAFDSFYNSNIDATSTQDYFGGIASGMGSFDFSVLGIHDDIVLSGIKVYPNPVKDALYLKGDIHYLKAVDIYSMSGQHILTIDKNFERISTSNLAPSIYFVKLSSEETSITFKIIKH